MTSNDSNLEPENENKMSQRRNNSGAQKSADTKISGSESSVNTAGGKPERRKRKFSPLEKDISSRLFPGANMNSKHSKGSEAGKNKLKNIKPSKSPPPKIIVPPSEERKNNISSTNDAPTSSSSFSSENVDIKVPQQDIQETPPVAKKTISREKCTDKSDLDSSNELKRKLDSNLENTVRMRDSKKIRKTDSSTIENNPPESFNTSVENITTQYTSTSRTDTTQKTISQEDNEKNWNQADSNANSGTRENPPLSSSIVQVSNPPMRGKEIKSLTASIDTTNECPKKQHILALLEHRKMLLESVVICKDTSKTQLDVLNQQPGKDTKPINKIKDDSGSNKIAIPLDKKSRNIREQIKMDAIIEIKEFRKMSDLVSQTIKKQRSFQGTFNTGGESVEKNRSTSLRRTSSKKLGTNDKMDSFNSSCQPSSQKSSNISPNPVTSGNDVPRNIINLPTSQQTFPNNNQNEFIQKDSIPSTYSQVPNTMQKMKSITAQNYATGNKNRKKYTITPPKPVQTISQTGPNTALSNEKSNVSVNQYVTNGNSLSKSNTTGTTFNIPSTSSRHLHNIYDNPRDIKSNDKCEYLKNINNSKSTGAVMNGHLSTEPFPPTISKVKTLNGSMSNANIKKSFMSPISEISVLCQKRKKIVSKLMSRDFNRTRKQNVTDIPKKINPQTNFHGIPQNISRTTPAQINSVKEKNNIRPKMRSNLTRLPPHRKTQWDYLLDEMRWLASDFMEERKWKISLASTISNIIISNKTSIVEKFHDCKESINHVGLSCEQPTPSDIAHAKQTASAISFTLTEHWDNMIDGGAAVDEDYGAFERIKLIKRGESKEMLKTNELDHDSGESKETSMRESFDESQLIKEDRCISENGDKFEIMDARITEISQSAVETRKQSEQLSTNEIDMVKNTLSGCGLDLTTSQLRAVQYVENIWNMQIPGSLRKSIDGKAWKKTHYGCGAVLNGGLSSGKTITTGAILWKFRNEGPQLVICSPTSLIQWRHEIGRFNGLRLFIMGNHGGSYGKLSELEMSNLIKLRAGDIVIGDFSSLQKEESKESENQNFTLDSESPISTPTVLRFQWASVTIDLRHSKSSYELSRRTNDSNRSNTSSNQLLPPNLWRVLHQNLQFIDNERKRKLIITGGWEFSNVQKMERNLSVLDYNNHISKIFAFLFPASILSFYTPRRILLWAKRKHQSTKTNKMKKSADLSGIQDVLQVTVENFQFTMESISSKSHDVSSNENESTNSISSNIHNLDQRSTLIKIGFWKVLKCEMSVEQKASYRKCCFYVRGALSAYDSSRTNHGVIAAKAIIRLRRTCLHSNIWDTLNLSMSSSHNFIDEAKNEMRNFLGMDTSNEKSIGYNNNCSQPDIAFANYLLKGSTKIAELLKILLLDANIKAMMKMEENESKISLLPLSQIIERSDWNGKQFKNNERSHEQKKVLILASLPEAQLLLHRFLNSCGIPHAILAAPSNKRESKRTVSASTAYAHSINGTDREVNEEISSIFKWACSQTLLSQFDKHSHRNGIDVLISSPVSIAGTNGGISAGVADIVISFDEDWSGREMKLLEAIFHRSRTRKRNDKSKTMFVKLLCADSCEESFFLGCQSDAKILEDEIEIATPESNRLQLRTNAEINENKNKHNTMDTALNSNTNHKTDIDFQTDVNGYIVSARDEKSKNNILVLGRQILDYRNKLLSNILHIDLAQDFATGKGHRFLPFNQTIIQDYNEKSDSKAESSRGHLVFQNNRCRWYEDDFKLGDALASIEAEVCPLSNDLNFRFKLKQPSDVKHIEKQNIHFAIASPHITDFSNSFGSRMDLQSMPVRLYCEHFGRDIVLRDNFTNKNLTESIGKEFDADLAESWRKSGLGCPPGNQAMPLLCYKLRDEGLLSSYDEQKNMTEQVFIDNESSSKKRKHNDIDDFLLSDKSASLSAYDNFLSHWIRDGNDGQEHLLYAPPIFPGLLAGHEKQDDNPKESITPNLIANMTVEPISSNFGDDDEIDKAIMASSGDIMDDLISSTVTNILSGGDDGLDLISLGIPLGTQEKIDSTNDSSLLDVELQLSADLPDSSSAKAVTIDAGAADSIGSSDSSPIPKFSNGEPFPVSSYSPYFARIEDASPHSQVNDYGLLGIGAFNLKINSKEIANKVAIETSSYKFWRDPFYYDHFSPESYYGDSLATAYPRRSESHFVLDSMLLYVKKFSQQNHMSTSSTLLGKNTVSTLPFGFNKPIDEAAKAKDQTTKKVISKQQLDAIKTRQHIITCVVKSKVEEIDEEHALRDENIPLIVALSDSAKVGDKAKEVAISQRKALEKNQTFPTVVDFGPFHGGYLYSSEGMSGISDPVSLVGTSLPMGVKLTNIENGFDLQPWTQLEDLKLKEAASKFFPNWNIISHFVSDLNNMNSIRHNDSLLKIGSNILRSPRQCKERLHTLFKSHPSLREEIKRTNRFRENISSNDRFELKKYLVELHLNTDTKGISSVTESEKMIDGSFSAVTTNNTLLPSSAYCKKHREKIKSEASELEQQQNTRIDMNKQRKKRFINISSTAMKRDRSSLPIPGYTGDSNVPLAIVQSHHSHILAVNDVVRQSNSGTAEMWPLPLLDLADKQRSALNKSKLQEKPASYTHSTAQQGGSQSTMSQHRSGLNTNNSVASIPQHVVKHQPRQQQNTHTYQPIQKMQSTQQQTLVQHTHPHANVAYSKQQSPAKNHSIQNQHELVKQAARAAALAPSTNNRIVHNKMNLQRNVNTGQPVPQRQIQMGPSRDFAATNDPLSIHASMSSNNGPPPPLPLQHQRHHPQHSSVNAHGNVPPIGMSPIRGNTPPRTSNRSSCK